MKVDKFVEPGRFDFWKQKGANFCSYLLTLVGEELGFKYVASGPMVRSSYKAGEYYLKALLAR